MFGSQILDTAIGLVFIFMIISLLCSAVREGIESLLKTRASHLEHGIRALLQDRSGDGLARVVFEHPLIFGLFAGDYSPLAAADSSWPTAMTRGKNLPSYIPSRSFALALLDIAARGPITDAVSGNPDAGAMTLANARANVLNLGNAAVQRVVLNAIDTAQGDFERAVANIESWYDSAMARVSGWYKRSTQWMLFAIGLAVAVGWNINTLTLAEYLFIDTAAREAVVAQAGVAVASGQVPQTATLDELQKLKLPIGWPNPRATPRPAGAPFPWRDLFHGAIGWILTAVAASLGAPFWFDVLNRIMLLRSTVKPPAAGSGTPALSPPPSPPTAPTPVMPLAVTSGPAAATAAALPPAAPPLDAQSRVDGCDVPITDADATADEDLPPSQGGVA